MDHTAAGGGRSTHTHTHKKSHNVLHHGIESYRWWSVCMYRPHPELCVCPVAAADRASELSGHSTAACLHTPPGRATLPSSGD